MTRTKDIICPYCGDPVDPEWNEEWGKGYHTECMDVAMINGELQEQ